MVEFDIRFREEVVDLLDLSDFIDRAFALNAEPTESDRFERDDPDLAAIADLGESSLIRGGEGPSCSIGCAPSAEPNASTD
jgi:hypothetical protein